MYQGKIQVIFHLKPSILQVFQAKSTLLSIHQLVIHSSGELQPVKEELPDIYSLHNKSKGVQTVGTTTPISPIN